MQIGFDAHLRLRLREGRVQIRPRTRFRVLVPPVAPSDLACVTVSSSQIDLSWTDNSTDELGFVIYRGASGGPYAQIDTVGAGVTSYQNMGLPANTQQCYVITAFNADGQSAQTAESCCTTDPSLIGKSGPGKWMKRYWAHRIFAGNRLGDWIS